MDISSTELIDMLIPWLIRLGWAIVILVAGRILAKWLSSRLGQLLKRQRLNDLLVKLAVNTSYIAMLIVVLLSALNQLGIDTTSALAVFGAASLAVGLAVKDSLSNFASGVLIAVFEPFSIGHYVEAGGSSGTVREVGMFNTILLTPDNKRVIVPNSVVYNDTIVNHSSEDTRRVDMVFGIGYEDDFGKATGLVRDILDQDDRILADPAPVIAMVELADSSVNFNVRPWVKNADYWSVRASVLEKVKASFDANGISIPYPQRDVHLHNSSE